MSELNYQQSLLKQLIVESFDPITLKHREMILEIMVSRLEKPITAEHVSPYYSDVLTDTEAMGLFILNGIAEILEIESGRKVDDDAFHELRRLAHRINTPEMTAHTLVGLILERMPGSATYRSLH